MILKTVCCGFRDPSASWYIDPISLRYAGLWESGLFLYVIVPLYSLSSPRKIFSRVVFPAPLSPCIPRASPS